MSGILCLKWNNHTSTFIKTLDILRSKELYCDATIACHGKYYPVHRFVLTTCSEYFEEIFERTQCKHPFIIVKDIEEMQLEALLNYMYKGEVNVLQERLPGLIRAAEALKVKGLAVSEDNAEEKKPTREKRKSNISSSPLQPKMQKLGSRHSINTNSHDSNDDEIPEIENRNFVSPKRSSEQNSRECTDDSKLNAANKEPNFENNLKSADDSIDEAEVEDIKIEPVELFENMEDDYIPNSEEPETHAIRAEESLFVSLLSPNNTNSVDDEEDVRSMHEGHGHAIPQCSSWNDDVSPNSDNMNDEMDALKMKPMISLKEEESLLGESIGGGLFGLNPFLNPAADSFGGLFFPHQCPHCSHRTKTKPELYRHVAYCHSDFRFTCSLCHYKCRTNGLLKKHMLKHTEEKPYLCPLCPYKTARKQHLVRHSKLHTGEKPFSCEICSYRASRKDRLREHLRKHRDINALNCDVFVTPALNESPALIESPESEIK